ncbi:ATP-binding protein [Candidatus Dependentiae bacterium]|nr:ATP-binding protein [Candidatus Dependentiae bacterium]
MDVESVKKYFLDFYESDLLELIQRDIELSDSNKIKTIIGCRRCGKTYRLFGKINALIENNVSKKQIIYLNFENVYLRELKYAEIHKLIEIYYSIFPESINKKLHLFIDEPQVIDGWENALRSLHDERKFNIYITGSSSNLLSKEIATALRGRAITYTMLTCSFKEFLKFKEFEYSENKISSASQAKIIHYLDEYIWFGGFPEIIQTNNERDKLKILKDYFDLIIYKDIIDRYKIKNSQLIRSFISYLTISFTREISLNKYFNDKKSQGLKLSKNILYEYFSVMEDCFYIHPLRRFDYSLKNQDKSFPKIYLNDIGFINLYSLEDTGKRIENIVFLELRRMQNDNAAMRIHYWKSRDGKETDFIISEGKKITEIIQVCQDLSNVETKNREINSLLAALDYFNKNSGTIIVQNGNSQSLQIANKIITVIPLWRWLIK